MRKSLLKPGTTYKPSNLKSLGDRDEFSRSSGRSSRGDKPGHSRSRKSRSRSRSPLPRTGIVGSRDRGHETSRGHDRHRRSRSGSRDRSPPRSKSGGGLGLIAQAREQMKLIKTGKLRMDSPSRMARGPTKDHGLDARENAREPIRKSLLDRMGERKSLDLGKRNSNSVFANLDRAVKKAREERGGASGNWNKQTVNTEDRHPDKWGHSGYEEMYHVAEKPSTSSRGNMRSEVRPRRHTRSRSRTPRHEKNIEARRSGHQSFDSKQHGTGTRRSRSGSRSPGRKSRPVARGDGGRRISPLLSRKPDSFVPIKKIMNPKRSTFQDDRRYSDIKSSRVHNRADNGSSRIGNGISSARHHNQDRNDDRRSKIIDNSRNSKSVKSVIQQSKPTSKTGRGGTSGRGRPGDRRSFSGSITESSSRTPSPQLKRPISGRADMKGSARRRASTRSRSRSNARSTSSESSSDEDVLELHPRDGKRRSGTLSRSSRSSSSGRSNSNESVERESLARKTGSSSSSSSSSESDSEDAESDKHSVAMAKDKDRTRANQAAAAPAAAPIPKSTPDSGRVGNVTVGEKSPPKSTGTNIPRSVPKSVVTNKSANPPTSTVVIAKKKSDAVPVSKKGAQDKSKEPEPGSGDSESDSDSSSESDDEPRMTLSERFAKLTQMSTDKREFAKPEIAASDIDTKLKVVKDLRNADTKIYVNGGTVRDRGRHDRIRPKSPEHGDGEARYSSDDRRRHFERMTRDEPSERPVDWSDVRVRYGYYKDRGYFDERPLSLDEYVKWEAWWYQYRDWLEGEGYYDNNSEPRYTEHNRDVRTSWRHPHEDQHSGGSGTPRSLVPAHRRMMIPNEPVPLMSRPISFGGRRGHQPHHHPRDISPPQTGSGSYHVPISRRIGHAAGGSLVVNIRQSNYNNRGGGRGRLAGRIGVRRN